MEGDLLSLDGDGVLVFPGEWFACGVVVVAEEGGVIVVLGGVSDVEGSG